jgi:pimeloyl-ACP methyl ester carboxylesterase
MLSAATRIVGPAPLRGRIASIMLGRSILADPARTADVARFVAIMSRRKDIWRAVNGVIDRAGVEAELGRIRARTLVVVGDEDIATPRAKSEALVAAIPGSRLAVIPRAGHSSTVEEPAAVTAALGGFLTER